MESRYSQMLIVERDCSDQLDISIDPKHGAELLKKYDLKSNDAILAEEKHMSM
jgi:hypothetical protein